MSSTNRSTRSKKDKAEELQAAKDELTARANSWATSAADAKIKSDSSEDAKEKQIVACLKFTQAFGDLPEDFLLDKAGDLNEDAVYVFEEAFWTAKATCKDDAEARWNRLPKAKRVKTLAKTQKECTKGIKDRKTEFQDALNYLDVKGVVAFRDSLADAPKGEMPIRWKTRATVWASIRDDFNAESRNKIIVGWGRDEDPATGKVLIHGPYPLGPEYKDTHGPVESRAGDFAPPNVEAEPGQEFEYAYYSMAVGNQSVEFPVVVGTVLSGETYLECGELLAEATFCGKAWKAFRSHLTDEYRLGHQQYVIRDQRPAV